MTTALTVQGGTGIRLFPGTRVQTFRVGGTLNVGANQQPGTYYAVDATTWYADADADGFGDPNATTTACEMPEGCVAQADDQDCDVHQRAGLGLRLQLLSAPADHAPASTRKGRPVDALNS